jgi:hypothetical protein
MEASLVKRKEKKNRKEEEEESILPCSSNSPKLGGSQYHQKQVHNHSWSETAKFFKFQQLKHWKQINYIHILMREHHID